jgi:hypothetical protein
MERPKIRSPQAASRMIAADDIEFFMVFAVCFFGAENYLNPAPPASYNSPSLGDEKMH